MTVENGEVPIKVVEPLQGHALLMELLAECDRIGWENQPPLEDWSNAEAPWPPYNEDEKAR